MIHNHLQRALSLARRTGDRLLVVDRYDEDGGYVVMDVDEYERLIDAAAQIEGMEGMDEENEDEDDFCPECEEKEEEMPEIPDFDEENDYFSDRIFAGGRELDNTQDYGRINTVSEIGAPRQNKSRKRWEIPSEVKQAGEEAAPEDGFSEAQNQADDDRYYLETI
ncbi:hypothetical protein A2477_04530 [Candidatus Falkowbacteria bacterium RIFOXYC2_FULL_47_12]|uniref:Uncharacterized protein n=2 Tax=Candidatus Falkowiibacteriota TaxID=1752728 RepID=A0A1F5TLP6_9BACT|nr:MAG: hypothetical protein A2242_04215 [Candidatus Falkowbacteria bacterium RIFOXYA2_FULL_47_9]OGF39769.1 MAG: hypothetical protein A2477_04530 [Candidatus Falkowbacteria bacterium RIFOXYC2_FULL_47_12]